MKKTSALSVSNAAVVVAAAAVVVFALLLVFHPAGVFPAGPSGTIRSEWTMLEEPAKTSAGEASGVEVTVYQITRQPVRPGPMEFNYYAGLGLVKEKRSAEVLSGISWISLKDVGSHIDPTSIAFKDLSDQGAKLLEQNYDYDLVSQEKLLQKFVDKKIAVKTGNETIEGKLLSSAWGGLVLETDSGIVSVSDYKQIIYPSLPEGLLTTPTINWLIQAGVSGKHDFQLSYLTSGITWSADYVAVANQYDSGIDLQGWVSVRNDAGTSFRDAKLKLVAGDIHLVRPEQAYYPRATPMPMAAREFEQPFFTEEGLFEYHLYTLDRPTTVRDGELKQITLFTANGVPVEKQFVFDSSESSKVRVKLNFENKKENGLGIPMPKGKVRVYKPDSSGQLQFLGEDEVDHTAEGEKIRLFIGNAFDVVAEKKETDHRELGTCAVERSYDVALRTHKKEPVTVTVLEDAWGEWEVRKENYPHAKESAHKISWKVPVAAQGEATLSYTILERWC